MNCKNCGAPMLLIGNRNYFVCEYCSSFAFPENNEEGITILDEPENTFDCPVCSEGLVIGAIYGIRVLYCKSCRGMMLKPKHFLNILDFHMAQIEHPSPLKALNPEEQKRRIKCPGCKRFMETHPYYGPGNTIIDNCFCCAVLWLDHGELTEIAESTMISEAVKLKKYSLHPK